MNPYLISTIDEYAPIAFKALVRGVKRLPGLIVEAFAFVDDVD